MQRKNIIKLEVYLSKIDLDKLISITPKEVKKTNGNKDNE